MSINKSYKHSKSGNFTILNNQLINNPNLSFKAKGIFLYFFSKPQGWDVRVDYTASIMQDGETAIYSGLKELETQGYLIRQRFYQNGRVAGMEYHFADDKDFTNITNIKQEKLNLEKQDEVIINQEKPNDYIIKKNNNKEHNNKDNKEKNIKKEKTENDLTDILDTIKNFDKSIILHEPKLEKQLDKVLNDLELSKIDYQEIFQDKITQVLFLLCIRHKKTRTTKAIERDIDQLQQILQDDLQNALEEWNNKKWLGFKSEYVAKKTQTNPYYKTLETEKERKIRETREALINMQENRDNPSKLSDIDNYRDITNDDDEEIVGIDSNDIPF
jgi:hypothetical protein